MEVQRYLDDEMLNRSEDPFIWWNNSKHNYPRLSVLVKKNSCVLGTSVPCERLFSKAGYILNEKRTREKLEKLLFLNLNYDYISGLS